MRVLGTSSIKHLTSGVTESIRNEPKHCFPTFRRTHNGLCPSHTIFLTERRDGRALFTTDQYTAGLAECRHHCTAKGREVEGTPELKGRGLGCGHNARFRHANTKHSLEHVVVKGLLPSAMVVHPSIHGINDSGVCSHRGDSCVSPPTGDKNSLVAPDVNACSPA